MSIVLVLFALGALLSSPAATAQKPTTVLDTAGAPLRPGLEYYVLPADGTRGGLGVVSRDKKEPCPMEVIEDFSSLGAAGGVPVTFASVKPSDTVVSTSTDLNVNFSGAASTPCGPKYSTTWKLGKYEDSTKRWYVTTGGAAGMPGVATVSSWFKIEKVARGYKFVFCPHVCKYCKVVCGDVGVAGGDKVKRVLGLSNAPVPFVFKRRVSVRRGL